MLVEICYRFLDPVDEPRARTLSLVEVAEFFASRLKRPPDFDDGVYYDDEPYEYDEDEEERISQRDREEEYADRDIERDELEYAIETGVWPDGTGDDDADQYAEEDADCDVESDDEDWVWG